MPASDGCRGRCIFRTIENNAQRVAIYADNSKFVSWDGRALKPSHGLPQNKAAWRSMVARRLCHAGSGWGQYPVQSRYRFRVPLQRNSVVKLNTGVAG
jgi:hypothetical protein